LFCWRLKAWCCWLVGWLVSWCCLLHQQQLDGVRRQQQPQRQRQRQRRRMRRRQRHHDGTTTTENWTRSWSWKSYLAIWLYGPPTSGIRFDCRQQFRNFSLVNPPFREPLAGTLSLALSRGEFTRELLTRQVGARVSLSVMSGFSYFMCNFNTYYKLTALINVSVCV